MNMGLNGLNPLAYLGVQATTPPQLLYKNTIPTSGDSKNVVVGTFWLYSNAGVYKLFQLMAVAGGVAVWNQIYPVASQDLSVVTNSGTANPNGSGIINIVGDGVDITTSGAGNTVTITALGDVSSSYVTDSGTATPALGVINFKESTLSSTQGTATFTAPGSSNTVSMIFTDNATALDTGVGLLALSLNTGSNNSRCNAFGASALKLATGAVSSNAFGVSALKNLTTGSNCNAFGDSALALATTATNCSAFGNSALASATTATRCSAFGAVALSSLTTGSSCNAFGVSALTNLTTGSDCSAFGDSALGLATTATNCNAFGNSALRNVTTATDCCAFGVAALQALVTGSGSCAFGRSALAASTATPNDAFGDGALNTLTTGTQNCSFGAFSTNAATSASNNTAVGFQSLNLLLTGSNNTALGYLAGSQLTSSESNNIDIGHVGVATDSGVIRIGTSGTQTSCLVQGIFGVTVSAGTGTAVFVDTTGKLGTVVSSARYKDNIQDLGDISSNIMKMRPVSFTYKDQGSEYIHYGFIAEEVAEVFKELVIYKDDQPETIRYHLIQPLLLNELQKQAKTIDSLSRRIEILEEKLNNLI